MNTLLQKLPVFQTITKAWEKVKGVKAVFFAVWVCYIIALIIEGGLNALMAHYNNATEVANTTFGIPGLGVVISLVFAIIQLFLFMGYIYLGIRRAADMPIEFKTIGFVFDWRLLLRMIGLYICYAVIMLLPIVIYSIPSLLAYAGMQMGFAFAVTSTVMSVLAIVLMIYFMCRLYLSKEICIAQQAGPITSIKLSFQATKCNVWRLLGLSIINVVILIISAIPLGIGLIWSIPYLFINLGLVYKTLVVDAGLKK